MTSSNTSSAPFSDYASVQDFLYGLKAKGIKFGIDRMRIFARALGHPERRPCVLHVTGTNGKGSTSAMLDAILREAGWNCGLYTSPHLVRLGERVQVNRSILSEAELLSYTNELVPVAQDVALSGVDMHPTFFEFMTAMAFLQFARKRCEASVIEVGMGGLFDATNVVQPEVSVITSISLDHCEILGDTVEKIAVSKAGIIKPGRPVVIGLLPEAAEAVVRKRAAELEAPVLSVRESFGNDLSLYPETNLEGDFQRRNAASATLAARAMAPRWKLGESLIARALHHVDWPGRWQRGRVGGRPIIFDSSHNSEGAETLDSNLQRLVEDSRRPPVVITGILGAVRARPLLSAICRHAAELYLLVPQQARACSFEELESLIPASFKGPVRRATVEDLFPGPDRCTAGGPEDTVVITGSIYLLGEVLARLEPRRGPGEPRLQDF